MYSRYLFTLGMNHRAIGGRHWLGFHQPGFGVSIYVLMGHAVLL
jgi:hypothetical protein